MGYRLIPYDDDVCGDDAIRGVRKSLQLISQNSKEKVYTS